MQFTQHRDGDIQRDVPFMSLLQGSSNCSIQNSDIKQIHGDTTINQIQSNIAIIRFGNDQFTHNQRNWIRDIISTNVALPDINHNLNRNFLTQFIINLPCAEAVFNDYQNKKKSGPCFEGTRVALLREMADWVTNKDGSRMYILSGLAGIGKSAVAYTIALRAAELNLLGASFFFSRDEADRNNAKRLFTTIAYQLCIYNEVFAKAIGDALQTERGSAATTKDPQEQLQALIIDPLRSIIQSRTRPILVIVDALDECDEDDEYSVIMGLSQLVRDLPPFKVILTTRPKRYLDHFQDDDHKLFYFQDIEEKVVDGDIRLYLKHSLSLEQVQKHFIKKEWCATDEEIECLVHAAGRLFIIASTSVRYILDKMASNPAVQMQTLLRAFAEDRTPFKDLDPFYTAILRNVVPADCDNNGIVSRYQSVIGAIIFIQRPLSVSTLSHLIHVDKEDIRVVLDNLQSVILLGSDDVPRIYHKSFPDYLTDQARCKDAHLRIDPISTHTQIAACCFEIANKHLKYNILCLGKMARYMSNKDGLKEDGITDEQMQEKIPQELRYACVYWVNHLQVARIENTGLMNGLAKFVGKHTLHWFEVLSLIGNLDLARRALRMVLKLLNSTSSELYQLLSDALRFISKFYEVIERSALHTYYSALPFSPTDSLFYRQFIREAENNIFVIEGGPEKWDALVANPSHDQLVQVDFIKFSSDSALFFSSKELVFNDIWLEAKLKIWDAATGNPISTIPGQKFAISNDFSTIASSKDNIITYYNTNGSKRGTTLTTASSNIDRLALSDNGRIAMVLSDRTVSLWETKGGELIDVFDEFKGSEDRVRLQFSSTGTRLAYSLVNGSITRLRDGMNGQFIADLQCGSKHKFVFSGDGYRITSRSSKGDLALCSSESGSLIGHVRNVGSGPLAISENGSLLATSDLSDLTLWSESHGQLAQIKIFQSVFANSMVFSMDNMLAIGCVNELKLYDVKTHSFISTVPYCTFNTALALSPDCTRLAYGGIGKMYLWDIQGIDASRPPSNGAVAVTAIALSRDCSRLACGYKDGRVELWRTSPTMSMQRIVSYQGHKVTAMGFGPDGGLFASGSYDGTVNLCNSEDGSLRRLRGTLKVPRELNAVALSNSMIVAAGEGFVTLSSLDTLCLIYAFQKSGNYSASTVSISDESDLVAVCFDYEGVDLFDVVNRRTVATFKVSTSIHKLTFRPDKSHLVAQPDDGAFVSFDLINKCITEGSIFEHLIQLHNTPLWDGVPIWYRGTIWKHYVSAFFSQHNDPMFVLQIPTNVSVATWAEGSTMITLGCSDGRIVLLRLPTNQKDDRISRPMHYPSCIDTCPKGATSNPRIPMSTSADKESNEQVKRVGHAMRGVKTAIISVTDRVTRKSKK